MSRILAIDYGDVRVGLAMSDLTNTIATGLDTLVINGDIELLTGKIKEIVENYKITDIIVGYPKNMNGTLSKKTEQVDGLIERLHENVDVRIQKWDERLTTVMAYNTMKELGIRQKEKNKYADKLAAIRILQDYMDSCK